MIKDLNLKRYPENTDPNLQAWDAADDLILENLPEDLEGKRILIIGDSFGALALSLKEYTPLVYTDSYISKKGSIVNGVPKNFFVNDLDKIKQFFDLVLIKLPKSMSYFEDILMFLTKHIHSETLFICGSMIKHTPNSAYDLLAKYIGKTRTSLAKKKARLIFANFENEAVERNYPIDILIPEMNMDFTNHSNIFSKSKLDIGTRFLLENIPKGKFKTILDMGCGNGIIGIKAKQINPEAKIIFTDDSYMAIKSTKINYKKLFEEEADFYWTNCYEDLSFPNIDLVLCNPPFHQGNTIGDFIAWQMFQDAKRALNPGGIIRVIGNRHLGYHAKLKKIFGNSKVVAQDPKFMIIDSIKEV